MHIMEDSLYARSHENSKIVSHEKSILQIYTVWQTINKRAQMTEHENNLSTNWNPVAANALHK